MTKEGYIPHNQRKKILLICDDVRFTSGISTMAKEIVIGTSHHFNWVQIAGAIKHPDKGKHFNLNDETNKFNNINDADITLYPVDGYGDPDFLRFIIKTEKPDALMIFTDPKYFVWLFNIENEIRKQIPIIYYNIWDNLPYPYYNKSFYESCDGLLAISKQTENINKVVLGDLAKNKVIKYVPHGINEKIFFPIYSDQFEYLALQEFKKQLFKDKKYDFVLLYNARNIRRKSIPDLLEAYKIFINQLTEQEAIKCAFVLHTHIRDENGTDLEAVRKYLFEDDKRYNIIFDEKLYPSSQMNLLYNACDCTALVSSNEGWGLSLTESMMCGKSIIANVTGGMQDQLGFRDKDNKLIQFTKEFGSNHREKYKQSILGTYPVFPSNISLLGSIPTPYIYDDRCSSIHIAEGINYWYKIKVGKTNVKYEEFSESVRNFVTSDESMMSARWMCKNMIDGINETIENFTPRKPFELIQA